MSAAAMPQVPPYPRRRQSEPWGAAAMPRPRLTHAGGPTDVRGVASLAEAAEGAHGVDALAIGAQVWHHLALINICGSKTEPNKCRHMQVDKHTRAKLARKDET